MMRYTIFDPTGNITALVESPVAPEARRAAADAIMARHAQVEQVGFVTLSDSGAALRMAGGEFCGNAGMSAAALWLLRRGAADGKEKTVSLRVSGVERALRVNLRQEADGGFAAAIGMPPALEITAVDCGGAALPLVRMEGICHAVVLRASPLFSLREEPEKAERTVRALCASLAAPCLGLLFVDGTAPELRLTPLVYVPGSDTLFWENACASGSAAVGTYLSARAGRELALSFSQPGGTLRVTSDPLSRETVLFGTTRLTGSFEG